MFSYNIFTAANSKLHFVRTTFPKLHVFIEKKSNSKLSSKVTWLLAEPVDNPRGGRWGVVMTTNEITL